MCTTSEGPNHTSHRQYQDDRGQDTDTVLAFVRAIGRDLSPDRCQLGFAHIFCSSIPTDQLLRACTNRVRPRTKWLEWTGCFPRIPSTPLAILTATNAVLGIEQGAQNHLQDPTMPVILHLHRAVDARDRVEDQLASIVTLSPDGHGTTRG